MKSFVAFSLPLLAIASPIPADVSAAPPAFKINRVVYGGTGCPQGTLDIDYTNSGILPINFSKDFTASIGPNVGVDQQRKNCQINLDLSYSPGWSYAVYSADYTGYADIDSGVKGVVKAIYYFSGQTDQASSALTLQGPFNGKYVKKDDVQLSVWSPCSGSTLFNVNAEVVLTTSGYGSGTIATTKETGKLTNQLYIKWKQC